jgi:AraC-like DNA-binding protein
MIKTIALLSSVYVTIFWAIVLHGQKKTHSNPRAFLAKFMLLLIPINLGRFFHYAPFLDLYVYFDVVYLSSGLLAYPFYYIYIRLLTVDEKFSWKAQSRFLILPIVLLTIYETIALFAPTDEYRMWLLDRTAHLDIPIIYVLNIIRGIIRVLFFLQVVYLLIASTVLLRKYKHTAEQYYSDIQDGKSNNVTILNFALIFNCLLMLFPISLFHVHHQIIILVILPIIYAVDHYLIGYMGFKQKPINPSFEVVDITTEKAENSVLNAAQKEIHDKLVHEFQHKKLYLNSELNIMDVAQLIGSNRSYISAIINQQYNQNFCTFVNSYRINELTQILNEANNTVNEVLAEKAGFGSVKSMRRAVVSNIGLSFGDWRKQFSETNREL